jgi:4-diphosphocytidyl-2-C-methyl-D-erythritol kinase
MRGHFAPAKVNLALHVTGRRSDGYHDIDTLAAFAGIGDTVGAEPLADGRFELACAGPFAADLPHDAGGNLVLRAARLLAEAAGAAGLAGGGVRLTLIKRLPVASGIGGGSADAAATLRALRALWSLPASFDLGGVARQLGADVPMCLASVPLRARGRGEKIEHLAGAAPLPALLVNAGIAAPTARVFAALAQKTRPPIGELAPRPFDPAFLAGLRNDLEPAAIRLFPPIGATLDFLRACPGVLLARMSGSGATCFGLFADAAAAEAARRRAVDLHPSWWCVATTLGAGAPANADAEAGT